MIKAKKGKFEVDAREFGGGRRRFDEREEAQAYLDKFKAAQLTGSVYIDPTKSLLVWEAARRFVESKTPDNRLAPQPEDITPKHLGNIEVAINNMLECNLWLQAKAVGLRLKCEPNQNNDLTFGGYRVRDLQPAHLRLLKAECAAIKVRTTSGLQAPSTLQKKWVIVRDFFDWMVAEKYITEDPSKPTKGKKGRSGRKYIAKEWPKLSTELINTIIDHAVGPYAQDPGHYPLCLTFACRTGMRTSEQRALTWDQIDFDASRVRVNRTVREGYTDKNEVGPAKHRNDGEYRDIEIPNALHSALRKWKLAQPIEQRGKDLVFPQNNGDFAKEGVWHNQILKWACKAADAPAITWHQLRHYYVSVLIFDVEPSKGELARMVGHGNSAFTETQYGHWLKDENKSKAMVVKLSEALEGQK